MKRKGWQIFGNKIWGLLAVIPFPKLPNPFSHWFWGKILALKLIPVWCSYLMPLSTKPRQFLAGSLCQQWYVWLRQQCNFVYCQSVSSTMESSSSAFDFDTIKRKGMHLLGWKRNTFLMWVFFDESFSLQLCVYIIPFVALSMSVGFSSPKIFPDFILGRKREMLTYFLSDA